MSKSETCKIDDKSKPFKISGWRILEGSYLELHTHWSIHSQLDRLSLSVVGPGGRFRVQGGYLQVAPEAAQLTCLGGGFCPS